MNYKKIYDNLIQRAKDRNIEEGFHESHHIIPKSIGGSDNENNLVKLTYREHYLAHKLLVEIYPQNKSLITALWLMTITTNKALEKYNNIDKNLSDIEKHCLIKRSKEKLNISLREYEYCRRLYVSSMLNHEVSEDTRKKISNNTKLSMKSAEIIEKCRNGSRGSKHYYNKETKKEFKWFPGDPDIDLNIFSWGRPPISQEIKDKISAAKNINKTTYHNDVLQINYECFHDEISKMPIGWNIKKKEYHNNIKFKVLLKDVKFNLINKGYNYTDILFFYPAAINKEKRRKQHVRPSVFDVCYDVLVNWKTNGNFVEDMTKCIIDRIDIIQEKNKEYFNV